jgi:PAS domain S-box-containing protein
MASLSSGGGGGDEPAFQTRHAAVLSHIAEGFIALDEDLRLTAVNHVYEDAVGRCAAQLVGQSWDELFNTPSQSMIGEQLRRVLRTGESVEFEADCNGPWRRYSIRAFPYLSGVAALFRNRTEDHEANVRLQEAAALEAALSVLPQITHAKLNVRGVFSAVESALTRFTGFSVDELLTCRLTDIVRPRDRQPLMAALEMVLQGGRPTTLDTTLLVKAGEEQPVRLGVAAVLRDGAPDGAIVTLTLPPTMV